VTGWSKLAAVDHGFVSLLVFSKMRDLCAVETPEVDTAFGAKRLEFVGADASSCAVIYRLILSVKVVVRKVLT